MGVLEKSMKVCLRGIALEFHVLVDMSLRQLTNIGKTNFEAVN